jgi:molecular chaperone HscB
MQESFFAAFGLPQSFAVDSDLLSARFRDLQSAVHPDRFASATDAEKRAAMNQAVLVNDAYNTLRDPVKRAMHLLALRGIDGMIFWLSKSNGAKRSRMRSSKKTLIVLMR